MQGEAGQLLLDPTNIVISEIAPVGFVTLGSGDGSLADFLYSELEDAGQNSHLTPDTVEALLALNALTLEATNAITVTDDVNAFSENDLTLRAAIIEVIDARLGQFGGGDIVLETLQVDGNFILVDAGQVLTAVLAGSILEGGDIDITTHDLTVTNGAVGALTFGEGDSGQVKIEATGDVVVDGENSFITSEVSSNAVGDSGGVAITTNNLSVLNTATVRSSTFGEGDSGQVKIEATGDVVVDGENSFITSEVSSNAVGNSGGITITTNNLSVFNAATVRSSTFGEGDSGQVKVEATGDVVVDGENSFISSEVSLGGMGNSGGVAVTTNNLSVLNAATVSSSTFGEGDSGQVKIEATGDVIVNGAGSFIASQVTPDGVGNSGGVVITANNLSVLDAAEVSASTFGEGDSGQVKIEATGDVIIDGIRSFISSQVSLDAVGNSSGVSITTDNIAVLNGAAVGASTFGEGNPGQVKIAATGDIIVDGAGSGIASQVARQANPDAVGNNGGISITTNNLSVRNAAQIRSGVFSNSDSGQVKIIAIDNVVIDGAGAAIISEVQPGTVGNSGGISIITDNLSILGSAVVSTGTFGEGDSGQVEIVATGDIILDGQSSYLSNSVGISSPVGPDAVGNSGGISITTNNLFVRNASQISAITTGEGDSGQIRIVATGNIILNGLNASIDSRVGSDAVGNSSGISIATNNLSVRNSATIEASTRGEGDSGQIKIVATGDIILADSSVTSQVFSAAVGDSGGLSITTNNLSVLNDALVSASTNGEGNSGQVEVQATGNIVVDGERSSITSQVGPAAIGDSGGLSIVTNNLSVLNAASVSASTFGEGNSGQVKIQAIGDVVVDGADSFIDSQVNSEAVGDSGGLSIITNNLSVFNAASVSASTSGEGDSGQVEIQAVDIIVDGPNSLIDSGVALGAIGNSGGISITTDNLFVLDGAAVTARTEGNGMAGTLRLQSNPNGNLNVVLSGENSLISALTNGQEDGGDLILISNGTLTLQGPGVLTTESLGADTGAAGNLNISADSVLLEDGVELSTRTASVEGGGDINFQIDRGIILRRGSSINAESTNENLGSGSGGNISLDADFVLALPDENSDIIANAVGGDGGNILINAAGIFGLTQQDGFTTSELRANDTSDISANSQSGQQGTINLNADFEQTQSLDELPDNFINADQLVASSCIARSNDSGSNFVIAGNEGLAQRPDDATGLSYSTGAVQTVPDTAVSQTLQEPEGIYQLADGRLVMGYKCQQR